MVALHVDHLRPTASAFFLIASGYTEYGYDVLLLQIAYQSAIQYVGYTTEKGLLFWPSTGLSYHADKTFL